MPPNILWIMTDQHRRDCVGAYSDRPVRTPHLDALAARSAVFQRHYSTCPLCVPARASLHTGRYSHSCGAIVNGFGAAGDREASQLNPGERTIGELMAESGYRVGHVGVDHVRTVPPLSENPAFSSFITKADWLRHIRERGLELPDMSPHQHPCPTRIGDSIVTHRFSAPKPGRHPFELKDFEDVYFADRAAEFIRESPEDQPTFLMCFLWMPHPPFVIPEPYFSMYDPADIELPPNVPGTQEGKPGMHLEHLPGQVGAGKSPDDWREAWAAYYGCVTLVDHCIGKVLEAADERWGLDETAVIFHPDHGEMLGAHQYFQKMVCYEESIHLPMMVSAPGAQPGPRDQLTSHVDIAPTILDLCGAPVPEAMQGHSLRPLLGKTERKPAGREEPGHGCAHRPGHGPRAQGDAHTPRLEHGGAAGSLETRSYGDLLHEAVFCEYNGNLVPDLYQRCVVSVDHKYIWNRDDMDELYDLREDPWEMRNVASEPALGDTRNHLRDILGRWMRDTGDFLSLD